MTTTSQVTKGSHPLTYLRKLLVSSEVATKHFSSTHEKCLPQNSPFDLTLIHSFIPVCVHIWTHLAHKHHLIYINFYTCLDFHSSQYTLYHAQHNHVSPLDTILSILHITNIKKHINKIDIISFLINIVCLHVLIHNTQED